MILVCNHVGYSDAVPLCLAFPRRIRFLSAEWLFRLPVLGRCLQHFQCIPVNPGHATSAIRKAAAATEAGEVVCIFPEGQLTRTGSLQEIRPGFELIARKAGVPVLVAHLDGLWGSLFSFERGRYFWKIPRRLRFRVGVRFSKPIPPEQATPERVRAQLLRFATEARATPAQIPMDRSARRTNESRTASG